VELKLTKIRQQFDRPRVVDLKATLGEQLSQVASAIRPGASVAIAVGSRGITDIGEIVRTTVDFVKAQGACPFIIPAMGSHGGATAEGQAEVLASLGVTEPSVGAAIRSSMEVVELPQGNGVARVFMDRYAYESDGVIVINRIKPHTDYHDRYESGLVKMCVIGLGKHRQALEIHRFGIRGLRELIPEAAERILGTGKILAGIGIVENAYHETMVVRALRAERIMAEEPKLSAVATANMPKLPVEKIDVLIIDRMGKDISGTGLDPNIIGRMHLHGHPEPTAPDVKVIVVCDLTEGSHGNAIGMALADLITRQLYDKIDFAATYENAYTSTFLERANVPFVVETVREALDVAMRRCRPAGEPNPRIVRIRDTLNVAEAYVSEAILDEVRRREEIEVVGEPVNMLDDTGQLTVF